MAQNRWNPNLCHDNLALIGPDRLIVQFIKGTWGNCSVFAERPISTSGIFYYEVKILAKPAHGHIHIGLATRQMPINRRVGYHRGTYAYESDGTFWGHEVGDYQISAGVHPFIVGKPPFDVGDVVGCGVNLATRQIIYTRNGQRLDTTNLFVASTHFLFPCVSLYYTGDKIEANFGPADFQWNIADGI